MSSSNPHSVLSFRDMPSHPASGDGSSHQLRKLCYKPAPDLAFDIEMEKRAAEKLNEFSQLQGASDDPESGVEVSGHGLVEFGKSLVGADDEFDEETLERLSIPPPAPYYPGLERELRPTAIFIYNRSIALLKTDQIIGYVLQSLKGKEATFEHLEWIDDFSCVLAFSSILAAIDAFTSMLFRPDEVEGENGLAEAIDYLASGQSSAEVYAAASDFLFTLRPAKPFPNTLFHSQKKNKLLCPTRPEQLIPFIRFATINDVKELGAAKQSLFYALHGKGAGKQGVETVNAVHNVPCGRGRPAVKRKRSPSRREDRSHEELSDMSTSQSLSSQLSKRISSRGRRSGAPPVTSVSLDDELDRFMSRSGHPFAHSASNTADESTTVEDAHDNEEHDGRSCKRRVRSGKSPQLNIELFADRPGAGGGNLRDEAFLFREDQVESHEARKDCEGSSWIPDGDPRSAAANQLGDEELIEEVVEMIDEETGKKVKRVTHSRRRKCRSAGRWGPLFGRLF